MSERVDAWAGLKGISNFAPKTKAEKPVAPEALAQVAEENNFTSRQPAKPAKKADRRKPRIHRTGRNVQFNAKATPETIAKFYRLADEKKVTLGEAFEMAVDALEREGQ